MNNHPVMSRIKNSPERNFETRSFCILSIAVVLSCLLLTVSIEPNVASRFATAQSLVEQGTFAVGDTALGEYTCDKVFIEGKYFSSKPPLQSVLIAFLYWILWSLVDISFASSQEILAATFALVFGIIPFALFLQTFIRKEFPRACEGDYCIPALIAICFGTLANGYATTVTNHIFPMLLAYLSYRMLFRNEETGASSFMLGLFCGMISAFSIICGSLYVGVVALFHFQRRGLLESLQFLLGALPFIVGTLFFYYELTGLPVPFYLQRDLYDYPGSIWRGLSDAGDYNDSRPIYLFHLLFGHHGFYSMTPLFLFSTWRMLQAVFRRDGYYSRALFSLLALAVLVIPCALFTSDYSGLNVGVRWFLILIPTQLVFLVIWMREFFHIRSVRIVFQIALGVSIFNCFNALFCPWCMSFYESFFLHMSQ